MFDGILDTVGLAVTVAFAAPVAIAGVFFLGEGDLVIGIAFLAVAGLMVFLKEYVVTPEDVPLMAAQRAVGAVVRDPEADGEDGAGDPEAGGRTADRDR